MTIKTLKNKKQSNRAIARSLGVTEGAIRHQLKKLNSDPEGEKPDGRKKQAYAEGFREVIEGWVGYLRSLDDEEEINCAHLYEWLVAEHGYTGAERNFRRWIRKNYPPPKKRTYRRVETPPGVQAQVDWCERKALIGGHLEAVYGFWMVLSHSRMESVVWTRSMDQQHWQHAHNEAFRRLGGVPACVRIDNLKTGMAAAGPKGRVNPRYAAYARSAGFHVDACLVRHPEAKGKVENRIAKLLGGRKLSKRAFADLAELQTWTDEQVAEAAATRTCPPTGQSVVWSWQAERPLLRTATELPEPFDLVLTRKVHKDCTVRAEGRTYSVPFRFVGMHVEVRGTAGYIEVWHQGSRVARHERNTPSRLLIDPAHYEGEPTETHLPPMPVGKVGRKIFELAEAEVEMPSAEWYEQLAAVMEVGS